MANEQLVDAANAAVNKVFGDTSVSKRETRDALEEIRSNIDSLIDVLSDEIANEEEE